MLWHKKGREEGVRQKMEKQGKKGLGEVTQEELIELESRPKTQAQIVMDYVISLLPLVAMGGGILEYLLIPDVGNNGTPMTYVYLIAIFAVAYAIYWLVSFRNKEKFRKVRYKAPLYTGIMIVLTIYDLLTLKSGKLPLPYFPWVNQIANAIIGDRVYLVECTLSTLRLLMLGYLIGAAIGLVTGVACGYSKKINYWISPIMKFLGPIPTTTWIPVVLVLASSLFKGSVFIIALGVWYSVALATITGISNVDRSYYEAARTLGAKSHQLVFRIAIPSAVPSMFQGLHQGMTIACTALMVAEMMGTESGLGWYITWQKSWAQYGKMYAAIVLICIIFTLVIYVLQLIRKFATRWQKGVIG